MTLDSKPDVPRRNFTRRMKSLWRLLKPYFARAMTTISHRVHKLQNAALFREKTSLHPDMRKISDCLNAI